MFVLEPSFINGRRDKAKNLLIPLSLIIFISVVIITNIITIIISIITSVDVVDTNLKYYYCC